MAFPIKDENKKYTKQTNSKAFILYIWMGGWGALLVIITTYRYDNVVLEVKKVFPNTKK